MRYLVLVLLFVSACTPVETGGVSVRTCPDCSGVYDGFSTCAFFDADREWAREGMLVDSENHLGVGTPIYQRGFMHHKFCFNESHAAFGSANPTRTGLRKNDNLVAVFESAVLADAFAAEYAYLQGSGSGRHVKRWTYNGRSIAVFFCPRDSCEERVLDVLSGAEESVVFLAFSFTSDAIGELLREKHAAGVEVRGVVEGWGARGRGAEFVRLVEAGVPVVLADTPGVMHHKAFVVDERVAIVGSYNPTASATERNAETVVVTEEPAVVGAVLFEFAQLSQ